MPEQTGPTTTTDPSADGEQRLATAPREEVERGRELLMEEFGSQEAFEQALEETIQEFDDGDIVEGVIVKVDADEALLDIGFKSEGVIPARELSIKNDVDPSEVVEVGDVVEALVLQKEDHDGRLVLSKKRAQYERAWSKIEEIHEAGSTVTGTVIEVVKGGLILDIGLRGFLPASLVEMRRVRDLHPYVGRELECKVIELDKNRNNVVLSRRKFLEETQAEFRREFLEALQKGEVRRGVVSSIVNFGAFVDLGGVDGLVHVSQLSWKHVDHPSEVVEVGEEVEVRVLDVDLERERVSLSLKSTQEDPWQQFAREQYAGGFVDGRVTKLVPFGAFVEVAEGIEGLVHISELADAHVETPEQVVAVGDQITVKIIDIDEDRRRISLSLKQAVQAGLAEEPEIAQLEPSDADEGAGEAEAAPAGAMGAAFEQALGRQGQAAEDDAAGPALEDIVAELRSQAGTAEPDAGEAADEAAEAAADAADEAGAAEEAEADEAGAAEEAAADEAGDVDGEAAADAADEGEADEAGAAEEAAGDADGEAAADAADEGEADEAAGDADGEAPAEGEAEGDDESA